MALINAICDTECTSHTLCYSNTQESFVEVITIPVIDF